MPIQVRLEADGWHVFVGTPDEGHAGIAQSPTEALSMLAAWGCHSTDATDALDESGVDWRPMHDAEVLAQREDMGDSS